MKVNNLLKENPEINDNAKENIYFEMIYKSKKDIQFGNLLKKTRIFNEKFINENQDKCKILCNNKEYELKEYFEDIDNNYNNKDEISFILRINKNITDISYMF